MNENLCIALITTASIFAGFLVAFLSSYLTTRNREYDENKRAFDVLGRKLTLFRQLCGFVWNSDCLDEQRCKLKANEPAFDEEGYVKSFMHAIDALHRDLLLKQYKQNPYIDYRDVDLDKIKTLVNSIWYDLIHKNYQEIHFCHPLDCPLGTSQGYFNTIRKELSFGNEIASEGMDDGEFGTIAGNVECEVIEDMEVLQYKMRKSIDCDVVGIVRNTIVVFVSGIVIPLFLLWAKDYISKIGCWNNLIMLLVIAIFLYSIVLSAKHTWSFFQKQESSKGKTYTFKQIIGVQHFRQILTFSLTVGLSGFLFVGVLQCHKEETKDSSPLIEQTNTTMKGVQKTQSEILKEVQSVNANIDSLIQLAPNPQEKVTNTRK